MYRIALFVLVLVACSNSTPFVPPAPCPTECPVCLDGACLPQTIQPNALCTSDDECDPTPCSHGDVTGAAACIHVTYTDGGTSSSHCACECNAGEQCHSGCCAPVTDTNYSVCASESICNPSCAATSAACSVNSDCCGFAGHPAEAICISTDSVCHAVCSSGTDCKSGCCAGTTLPDGDAGMSVCAAASNCQ